MDIYISIYMDIHIYIYTHTYIHTPHHGYPFSCWWTRVTSILWLLWIMLLWMVAVVSSLSCVWLFATLWTVPHQASLSIGFPKQEYWSRLPFPSPGDLPDPRIKPISPVWQVDSLPLSHLGNPLLWIWVYIHIYIFSRSCFQLFWV